MVVGIAIERRVGDHDGAIALSPERDVVAPVTVPAALWRGASTNIHLAEMERARLLRIETRK
jgi:hypothetical protein